MSIQLTVFFLIVLFLPSCGSNKTVNGDTMISDKDQHDLSIYDLMDKSKSDQKPILIDLYTDWCLPCKIMDEQVYSDRSTVAMLQDSFIFHKIDAETAKGRDMAFLFKVDAYPGLLYLDTKGRLLKKHQGGLSIAQFNHLCEAALHKFHNTAAKISG